jgi:hypothetical protein
MLKLLYCALPLHAWAATASDSVNGVVVPPVDINIKVLGTQVGPMVTFETEDKKYWPTDRWLSY